MTNLKGRRSDQDRQFDDQVGTRIRDHRVARGMTQSELAAQSGVKFQQIQKYELGTNRVAASRLYAISKALGAPMAVLLGEQAAEPEVGRPDIAKLLAAYDRCAERKRLTIIQVAEMLAST